MEAYLKYVMLFEEFAWQQYILVRWKAIDIINPIKNQKRKDSTLQHSMTHQ